MGNALESFGLGIAGQAAGAGMGLLMGAINDSRQYNQQARLQGLQVAGQKQMIDYNYGKQMQMWHDTNYGAQTEEMRKAGLNPGLIYGMKGGGGITTGQAVGNVQGANAPSGGGEAVSMGNQVAQMALMKAQKENIEADTANKVAQKPKTETETVGINLDNQLKSGQLQKQLDIITTQAEQEIQKLQILETQNKLDANARLDKQLEIANRALLTGFQSTGQDIKNEQTRVEINALEQEIKNGIEKIKQGWAGIDIQQKQTLIQKYLAEFTGNHPELGKVLGGTIQRIANWFGKPLPETKAYIK